MHTSRRAGRLALCASVALLAACSSTSDETSGGSSLATAPPGTYGVPLDSAAPDPTEVATDSTPTADPTPSTDPAGTTGSRRDAVVQITYYGWNQDSSVMEVGGFVHSLVEEGGACTLTLTQGSARATATREATPNVTSTACGELVVPGDRLTPGTWSAVLTYESADSRGDSQPVEVLVP